MHQLLLISLFGPQHRPKPLLNKVSHTVPLLLLEGAPGLSHNSGLQDESAPAGEGPGPSCRMTPGKVHGD